MRVECEGWFVGVVLLMLAMSGCAIDQKEAQRSKGATSPDAGVTADGGGSSNADGSADTGVQPFSEPVVGGTEKTNEMADSPTRCGPSSHEWLEDESLGRIVEFGDSQDYDSALLKGVVRSQDAESPRPLEYDVGTEQFLYRTQDRGEFVDASAVVAYPKNVKPEDQPVDVLLLLHGTTGFHDACAPSDELSGQGLAALFASWGYFVVAPDYIGLKALGESSDFLHPYLVGEPTAIASLDAVRALPNLPPERRGGLQPSSEILVMGGSQGGHAALWVDRLAPYYAREIELEGTVATVPPADLVSQAERALDQMVDATGNTIAFLGAAPEWYGLEDRMGEVFQSPYDEKVPEALGSKCNPSDGVETPSSTGAIFRTSLVEKARDERLPSVDPWGCLAAENGLTTTSVSRIGPNDESYGMLFVLGEKDDLVHTPIERESFETLCERGMPMQFLECKGAGHVETTIYALPEILDFLEARSADEPFQRQESCEATAPVQCRGEEYVSSD
jgi:dienelactone hydrolase